MFWWVNGDLAWLAVKSELEVFIGLDKGSRLFDVTGRFMDVNSHPTRVLWRALAFMISWAINSWGVVMVLFGLCD